MRMRRLLERIERRLERGDALMDRLEIQLDRNGRALDRNAEAFDRNAEAFDRNNSTMNGMLADFRQFMHDERLRLDKIIEPQRGAMERLADSMLQMRDETVAMRRENELFANQHSEGIARLHDRLDQLRREDGD